MSRQAKWFEAQHYCRRYYTDLVTIRDVEDVKRLVPLEGWIGLRKRKSNEWKWSRGDELFENSELCK